MNNFDNISLQSRDRFRRWTSPAIENNLSIDTSQAGTGRTSWMSLVRLLSLTEAQYSTAFLSYVGDKMKFQNEALF